MRHLFTSDLHIGHVLVSELRGFTSVEQHDAAVTASLTKAVTPQDTLWILGDLSASGQGWYRALQILKKLPCNKRIILGNHDPAHPMHRKCFNHVSELVEVFQWYGTEALTRVCGHKVLVSHFPYSRDRGEPRYVQWRPRNLGQWLIHGHTHGTEKVTVTEERYGDRLYYPAAREIHVGWDAWRRPVADHEIAQLIKENQ